MPFAAVLVVVWKLILAASAGCVVYLFSRLALPVVFSNLDFSWPESVLNFLHYFQIDVCLSLYVGALTFKVQKLVALSVFRILK